VKAVQPITTASPLDLRVTCNKVLIEKLKSLTQSRNSPPFGLYNVKDSVKKKGRDFLGLADRFLPYPFQFINHRIIEAI
jgi:hypothetical protein